MPRAVMPGATRIHCYVSDEEARRQAEVEAFCHEISQQYSVPALTRAIAVFLLAIAAAAVSAFG